MSLAHYLPEDVVFLLGGAIPIDGFVDGTFIAIKKASSIYETVVSADGKVSRTQVENPLYSVTLSLASSSSSNEILTALSFADRKTGKAKLPLLIRDHSGTTLFYASLSWIENIPEVSFSTEVTERVWTFSCVGATQVIGGNSNTVELNDTLLTLGLEGLNALF